MRLCFSTNTTVKPFLFAFKVLLKLYDIILIRYIHIVATFIVLLLDMSAITNILD